VASPLRFQVLGPDGAPVLRYQTVHDRPLHLIVVRADLTGYQHLHPGLGADGTWSVPLTLPTLVCGASTPTSPRPARTGAR
jgi:hypothetical protein